jgi:hypothetical protein
MNKENTQAGSLRSDERPNAFWNRVYVAVVIATVVVIAALWAFSQYFK